MQISRRTRLKFADFASDFAVLREIDQAFALEDFEPLPNYVGPEFGQRRTLVGSYHAAIDFSDPKQVQKLVNVYIDAIDSWGRNPEGEFYPGTRELIRSLRRDDVPLNDEGELIASVQPLTLPLDKFNRLGDPRVVEQHLQRIASNIESDPAAAVGSAKELVESVCKFVLLDYGVEFSTRDDLLSLYKKVAKELKLNREAVPGSAKGSEAAHRVLQNLSTAVQSLAELRNELGIGHGGDKLSPAFARHARLAFNSPRAVSEFLLETWHERRPATTA